MLSIGATNLLVVFLVVVRACSSDARHFGGGPSVAIKVLRHDNTHFIRTFLECRGGDAAESDSDDDFDLESSDEETEDEEEEEDVKLTTAAVKATEKVRAKKTASAKSAVNAGLASEASKKSVAKKKKSSFKLPYVVSAFLNPFTVIAMTKAYWASLFNLNYITKVCIF